MQFAYNSQFLEIILGISSFFQFIFGYLHSVIVSIVVLMEDLYFRKATVKIDCATLPMKPDLVEVHANISQVQELPAHDVIQIEMHAYYHAIFCK